MDFLFFYKVSTMPSSSKPHLKTLHVRIQDRHFQAFREFPGDANRVGDFSPDLKLNAQVRANRFKSAFSLAPSPQGASRADLNLHSQPAEDTLDEYGHRQLPLKKNRQGPTSSKLRGPGMASVQGLGPSRPRGQLRSGKLKLGAGNSDGLSSYELGPGRLSEDAREEGM